MFSTPLINRPTSGVGTLYFAEGDSISTDGSVLPGVGFSYPTLYSKSDPHYCGLGKAIAVGGATLNSTSSNYIAGNSLVDRAAADDALYSSSKTCVLSVMIGANDLGGTVYPGGTTQYISDLAAYLDARRAAGWKVVICTILPRANLSSFNADRAVVNAAIVTWRGTHCDAICDFAADAIMGPDAAAADTTYYQAANGVHPTQAGHAILASIIRPILNSFATP